MKKLILVAAIIGMAHVSNSQNRWSIGVMLGGGVNVSKFSGGMETANESFSIAPHKTGSLGVYTRYKLCDHMSIQTGYDFSEIGFSYLFTKDYSLKKDEKDHFNAVKTSTCISRMPLMIIYSSKLNCRNLRFIAGYGIALNAIDKNWKSESNNIDGNVNDVAGTNQESLRDYVYKSQESHATSAVNASLTCLFGTEKVFNKGGMLSLTFQGNLGLSPLATSTIEYAADGTSYQHTFTNYGSFFTLGLTYFFMPVGTRKLYKSN